MYASGTVSLTHVKNIPVGERRPMALVSWGRSLVVMREERLRLKYWVRGDFGGGCEWCECEWCE